MDGKAPDAGRRSSEPMGGMPITGGVRTSGLGLGVPTAGSGIATEEEETSTGLDVVPATVDGGDSEWLVGGGFTAGDC